MTIYLQCGKEPVQLPVHLLPPCDHLGLEGVEGRPALLLEADGQHEVDDGEELVQHQVEAVRPGGQLPVELGCLAPVERLHRIHTHLVEEVEVEE